MKKIYNSRLVLIIFLVSSFSSFAQTGPGGVGKTDGTSDLVLWFNASSENNDNTSWNDDSGKGYDLSAGTGATLNSDVNGYKSYSFNGSSDFFQKSYESELNPYNFSVFTSNKVTSSSGHKAVLSNRDDYPQRGFILYSKPSNNNWDYWIGNNSGGWNTTGNSVSTAGSWATQSIFYDNSAVTKKRIYVNNNLNGTGTASIKLNTSKPFLVGAGRNEIAPEYYFKGNIGEIIMFKSVVNNTQRIIIDNYLSAKYGTSLSADDIYDQDDSGYGNFDHNVAGIGQLSSSDYHTNSKGSSIIKIDTPSSLSDNDFLFWGEETIHDSKYTFNTIDGSLFKLDSKWRVSKQNDLGTVKVTIKQSDLAGSGLSTSDVLNFIVDSNSDFPTKTSYPMILSGGYYVATVTLNDDDYFSLDFTSLSMSGYSGPGGVGSSYFNVLWLRSEDLSQLDNSSVSSWSDFSGNTNDVDQPSSSFDPTFNTNIVNGFPVVRFDGVNNERIRKTNFNTFPTNEVTAIYVNKTADSNDGVLSYASSTSDNDFLVFNSSNLSIYRGSEHNTSINNSDNDWHIVSSNWKSSNGQVDLWKDGNVAHHSTGFKAGTSITQGGSFAIGGEQDGVDSGYTVAQAHDGDFAEVIVFNRFLTKVNQIIVSNYLGAKYDISLSADDIYTNDNPANGNYDFKVAGIGQADDGSNHSDSKGEGIIRINTPSNLDNDEYLFWGQNVNTPSYTFATVASDYVDRLDCKWRVSKQGDLGSVTVTIKDSDFTPPTVVSGATIKFVVSSDNFVTKTSYDLELVGVEYVANNVTFNDGDYFSLEYFDTVVLDDTRWYNGSGTSNSPSSTDGAYKLLIKSTADGSIVLSENAEVKEIEIEVGGILNIGTTTKFEVSGDIINNGTFTIQSNSTSTGLLKVDGAITNGGSSTMTVQRHIDESDEYPETDNGDAGIDPNENKWQLVSSPVVTAKSGAFTGHFLNYYEPIGGDFHGYKSKTEDLNLGEGYVSRYDGTKGITGTVSNPMKLVGTINNSNKSISLKSGVGNTYFGLPAGFNLIGNPFTTNLNFDELERYNHSVIGSTMYYYVQDAADDNTGGVATSKNGWQTYVKGGIGNEANANIINISQAFGVVVDGNVNRTLNIGTTAQTLNTSNGFNKKQQALPNNYFELNAVSNNYIDRSFFKINNNLTDEFDTGYDAYKLYPFGVSPTVSFISSDKSKQAVCQSPEVESVELGFFMRSSGEVTLSLKDVADFDAILLEDKQEGIFTDLIKGTYVFNYIEGEDETGRFALHFTKDVLFENEEKVSFKIYSYNKNLYLKSSENLNDVVINLFNLNGQSVLNKTYDSVKEIEISTFLPNGVYILEFSSDKGRSTQRVILSE